MGIRSSEKVRVVEICDYSKLMRAHVAPNRWVTVIRGLRDLCWDAIRFRDPCLDVRVRVTPFRIYDTGVCDCLVASVFPYVDHHSHGRSAPNADISIEFLDRTGQHTVFHRETSRGTPEEAGGFLSLCVSRSELEASSCVNVEDDLLRVRFTVKERDRPPTLLQNWFSSNKQPEVAMSRSHALTVDSLSRAKASLLSRECVYSTRFAVGCSRWYLKLSPALAVVSLVRATKDDDDTVTRAEFSFELEGAVNVESGNMMHTFDRANPECEFPYQQPNEPRTSSTDRLLVRCFVQVIPAMVPTAVQSGAGVIPSQRHAWSALPSATAIPAGEESLLTPLLGAMHS